MPCERAKTMHFRVYDIDALGVTHDTGKEFSVSLDELNAERRAKSLCEMGDFGNDDIMMAMFKLFGFTIQSGHFLEWYPYQKYILGRIKWRGDMWIIKRVT